MTDKWSFSNVAEFREIFGVRECGNGNVARRNKILLETLKDKVFHKWLKDHDYLLRLDWCKISSMASLKEKAIYLLQCHTGNYSMFLMDGRWASPDYMTDSSNGICEDGSFGHIRYVRKDNGKVYKMKAGKMFRHIIESNEAGKYFPEALKTWLCEQFTEQWRAYAAQNLPKVKFTTDVTFADIYGNGNYECRNMGSCMNGNDQSSFYDDAVDATPAALVSEDGNYILARCVVFNNVKDEQTGKTLRLAERQYARNGDEVLKRLLILNLIQNNLIDGYKQVGADCCNSRSFVSNKEEDWSKKLFSIECKLHDGDTLSYQDSFKWYNEGIERAYNYSNCDAYECLDVTDSYYQSEEEEENYDDWHDCYTSNNVVEVWYRGSTYMCDEDRLDDFVYIHGEYHHNEEVLYCEYCDCPVLEGDECYSELTGEHYCCDECLNDAEDEYKRNNWDFSDYDNEYVESAVTYYVWDSRCSEYDEMMISEESLDRLLKSGRMLEYEGDYYYDFDAALRLPLDVVMEDY